MVRLARLAFYRRVTIPFVIGLNLALTAFAQESKNLGLPAGMIRKPGLELQRSATKIPEPAYPPLAKAAYVSGSVVVEVIVDEDGAVISCRAISGHSLLQDSAIEAARRWEFEPTSVKGVPVKVIGTLTFNFRLSDAERIAGAEAQVCENPNSPEAHFSLGQAYDLSRRNKEAIAEYTLAIQLRPEYSLAYFALGHAYELMRRDDEARDAYMQTAKFERVLDSAGQPTATLDRNAYLCMGQFHYRHSRFQDALEVLKRAASIFPGDDDIHIHLGVVYLEIGDMQSVRDEYDALKDKQSEWAVKLLESILRKEP